MLIELKKFGDILTSREAGKEAYSAFLPTLNSWGENEKIEIDFQGVSVLTPSWADEFIRPLCLRYGKKITFVNDDNSSVQAALQFANPDLDFSEIIVFQDKLVFSEKTGDKMWRKLTFPYTDQDALSILKNNDIKEIRLASADVLGEERLDAVVEMLNGAGIKTLVGKK